MNSTSHLKALIELEREGIPGLVEVLREEGIDSVRYTLWNATGWHRDYSPPAWRSRATEEQKRKDWEMAVRIEKIIATVLDEAHERQVEEAMDTLQERPESLYERVPNDLAHMDPHPVPPVLTILPGVPDVERLFARVTETPKEL